MKNFWILSLLLVFLSWMIVWCSKSGGKIIEENNSDQVLAYNDSMRTISAKCFEAEGSMWDIYNAYNWWSTEDVKSAIDDTVSECKDSMFQINNLWDIDWDVSLKDGVISLIQKMIERFEKLYEILPFLPLLGEGLGDEDSAIYEGIKEDLDSLGVEEKSLNEKLINIQRSFAEVHWYDVAQ